MVLGQSLPGLGLRGLHPGQQVGRLESACCVVATGVSLGAGCAIQPAMLRQVVADVGLERDFVVQCQIIPQSV